MKSEKNVYTEKEYNYSKWNKSIWKTAFWFQFNIDDYEACICIYSKKDANIESREEAKKACEEIVKYCKDMIAKWKRREIYNNLQTLFPKYI